MFDTTVDYFGRPATFFATYSGNTEGLRALLEEPKHLAHINLGVDSQGGHTLLFIALYGDANPETLALLLEKGADPFYRDNIGRIPLHIAANTADPKMLTMLLARDGVSELVDSPAATGQTPFHALCLPGTGAGVAKTPENTTLSLEILLDYSNDARVSLNIPDTNGLTPLILIKHYNNPELLKTCKEKLGQNCFEAVLIPENIDNLLKVDFFGRTPLLEAAFVGNKEIVASELNKGADPDFVNVQSGRNSLQVACCGLADGGMVSLILPQITAPLAQDLQGRTALHFSANTGRFDTTAVLLANVAICADINRTDAHGRTSLHALAMSSARTKPAAGETLSTREKTIVLLFDNGIDPEIQDIHGYTALTLAGLFGNTVVAERIKACIANRNALLQATSTHTTVVEQHEPPLFQSFLPGYVAATSHQTAGSVHPQQQAAEQTRARSPSPL